jgi:hypothetical protein
MTISAPNLLVLSMLRLTGFIWPFIFNGLIIHLEALCDLFCSEFRYSIYFCVLFGVTFPRALQDAWVIGFVISIIQVFL